MLRARLAALASELAETEQAIAHIHDQLAVKDPKHAAGYRSAADAAREVAIRVRTFLRNTPETTRAGA